MWIIYALLGALFAAVTAILIKVGITGVNPNLATAIRTIVVLVMAWGIVFATGKHAEIANITQKSWLFLGLSGIATGASWMFFYRALQMGEASKVIPIDKLSVVISIVLAFVILGEAVSAKAIIGAVLIAVGTLIMVL
jgi:transporter family protein